MTGATCPGADLFAVEEIMTTEKPEQSDRCRQGSAGASQPRRTVALAVMVFLPMMIAVVGLGG